MAPGQLDRKGIAWFVGLACLVSWGIVSPVLLHPEHLAWAWARLFVPLMMFGPSIAAFIVSRWVSPLSNLRAELGLRLRAPGRRFIPYWILPWVGMPLLVVLSIAVSAALGLISLDLGGLSGFRELIERSPGGKELLARLPIHLLALAQLSGLVLAPVLNGIPTFGEELGWRGYLLPRLLPLGQWRALILSGIIWGAWHAPIIALGHNYPSHPRLGVLAMIVLCVLLGILFGWLRLQTGSVWPAVIAHGALNGSAGLILMVTRAGSQVDTLHASITGWTGWLVLAAAIAVLVGMGRLPVKEPA